MSSEEQILICAVRYALGRMSYIVGVVAEYVALKRKELSIQCIDIIIQDISSEMKFYQERNMTLGMECDEETWKNLLEVLKGVAENE